MHVRGPLQVRVRPVGALASAILLNTTEHPWYNWEWSSAGLPPESWPDSGLFATTCSCNPYNPSGAPEALSVVQAYDHMMFS